eukprot:CAMPEP_0116876808 /NCGR_PEP_ID=MMETSP0463-20121206/8666_1 /TAXON_ID=181622 /ORGANISM="Strombidinopsis sp, Strain SopsisLIS2011" /LENGTH=49 /DNA_ID=CAMNT_0004523615 /DNA_START=401 /DNA_END=550 /DNA_ORIENTATION=-
MTALDDKEAIIHELNDKIMMLQGEAKKLDTENFKKADEITELRVSFKDV